MRKNLVKGMAALCMCAAFASCSHDTDFESTHQRVVFDNLKNQYSANFIKMYGEINPNQSWDFTSNVNASQARTRTSNAVESERYDVGNTYFSYCKTDEDAIKALKNSESCDLTVTEKINSTQSVSHSVKGTAKMIDWNNFFSAKLTPSFASIEKSNQATYRYYHLGFSYNNGEPQEMIANIRVVGNNSYDNWYDALTGSAIHHSYRMVNTIGAVGNGFWSAYYADGRNQGKYHYTPISQVREFTVTVDGNVERIYWGFDCDGDEIFTDVVCLVENYAIPEPIEKRYMIEDLGSVGDFDFNDIVVDFVDNQMGSKKAYIRAMGGTLDFTLNVAGQAIWTKSIDGPKLADPINVGDMVNTNPIDFTKVYAEIDVPGWIPVQNNISVTVTYKDARSSTGTGTYTIPFPEVGQVPMMFATYVNVPWMKERINFPEWWVDYSKILNPDENPEE